MKKLLALIALMLTVSMIFASCSQSASGNGSLVIDLTSNSTSQIPDESTSDSEISDGGASISRDETSESVKIEQWKYNLSAYATDYIGNRDVEAYMSEYYAAHPDAGIDEYLTVIDIFNHFGLNRSEVDEIIRLSNTTFTPEESYYMDDTARDEILNALESKETDRQGSPPRIAYETVKLEDKYGILYLGLPYGDTSAAKSLSKYSPDDIVHSLPYYLVSEVGIRHYNQWFESLSKSELEDRYTVYNFIEEFRISPIVVQITIDGMARNDGTNMYSDEIQQ